MPAPGAGLNRQQLAELESALAQPSFTNQDIASMVGCSERWVRKLRRRYDITGTITHKQDHTGRTKLTSSHVDALIEFLAAKNELYLDEMQWWLFQQFNLDISLSAISRRLRLVDFGKKKQELVAIETNVSLRAAWVVDISGYRADQFVFVDESGVDQRQGWRRTGWCPRGVKPTPGGGRRQGMRHQILPGLTVKGVLAYSIYEGIIDADCFLLWLKDMLLPMTTPFPGPNSVLVMDNSSFQFHNRPEAVCGQRGVKLLYLPPFSPEYNPVEGFYHDLRAHIRKHPRYVENSWETGEDWRHFLVGCVGEVGSHLKQIRGHFRKSMVPGVPDD